MKKIFWICAALMPYCVFGCQKDKVKKLDPAVKTPTTPEWKILWLIYPNANYPADDAKKGTLMTSMTNAQIELVKTAATEYKNFIENATKNKVSLKITIEVSQNPITEWAGSASNGYAFWPENMPAADKARLKFNKSVPRNGRNDLPQDYDCVMTTTPPVTGGTIYFHYAGVTSREGRWCHVPFYSINTSLNPPDYGRPIYVHEWIHQLERVFGGCREMPVLHEDGKHSYTEANLGITPPCHECKNERWYHDILSGGIVDMPGATEHHKGIAAEWWKYPPLLQDKIAESEGITTQEAISRQFCD